MTFWYGLDGQPIDMEAAEALLADGVARRVAHTRLFTDRGIVDVSTIFLVLDHNYFGGPPVLWETMVFGGPIDRHQWRYASREDAVRGHEETVSWARTAVDVAGATVVSDDHVGSVA